MAALLIRDVDEAVHSPLLDNLRLAA